MKATLLHPVHTGVLATRASRRREMVAQTVWQGLLHRRRGGGREHPWGTNVTEQR